MIKKRIAIKVKDVAPMKLKIKRENFNRIILSMSLLFIILSIILGIAINTNSVSGANVTNGTVITRVNVTNTEPTLYFVEVTPSSIDLSPGGTVNVTCNGSVYDVNGWDDIENVSATLYDISYGDGATGDNNYRYVNASCTNSSGDGPNCAMKDGVQENASCVCVFQVWYYASNGSWQCNMTVGDSYAMNSTNWSSAAMVNTVLGIDIPSTIDFGNLSVTEISSYVRENVTNWGNVLLNTSVRGYGGDNDNNNLSMICATGNISNIYMRYAINTSVPYESMMNITNVSAKISGLTVPVRTSDTIYGNSTNATFWKLEIPTGISGECNGTVIFEAIDAS